MDTHLTSQVPPTNGWMIELGYHPSASSDDFKPGYRYVVFPFSASLSHNPTTHPHPNPSKSTPNSKQTYNSLTLILSIYISGDTLLIPELSTIPERYPHIDLLLIHLGGTTIPSPSMPLLMVTMDAEMGVKLVQLVKPDLVVPVHYE